MFARRNAKSTAGSSYNQADAGDKITIERAAVRRGGGERGMGGRGRGPIFLTFFPKKITSWNFLEKLFFETFFCHKFHFSQHFWGKIFCGIFPGKNVRKIGPYEFVKISPKMSPNAFLSKINA
jgi:hypothetical protein